MSFCGTKPSIGRIKRIKQDAVHAIYSSKDQVMNQNKKKKKKNLFSLFSTVGYYERNKSKANYHGGNQYNSQGTE